MICIVHYHQLCWKLDNNTMWATSNIHVKYINDETVPSSHIWNNIRLGWQFYSKNLAWKVGNVKL